MAKKKNQKNVARYGGSQPRNLTDGEKVFLKHLGRRIQELRVSAGMTSTELALSIGVTFMTQSRRENGHSSMPIDELARYAKALGCKPGDFLVGVEG